MWPQTDKIPLTSISFPPVKVQGIDENHQLYGNFIGVQFVFDEVLDATMLAESIEYLILQHPELTGCYDRKGHQVVPSEEHVWLRLFPNCTGHARDHAQVGTVQNRRRDFLYEPSRKDVQSGKAILSSFMLTSFEGKGSILGMAISHVLVDAAGFHLLAQYLAQIYTAKSKGEVPPPSTLVSDLPVFKFGAGQSRFKTIRAVKARQMAKPLNLRGPLGHFIRRMIIKALGKITETRRVVIALSANEVARLKETVLRESGEDWISTNIALCTHFTHVLSKLMYSNELQEKVQIAQLLDLRNRYFPHDKDAQGRFSRNAILINAEVAEFPGGIHQASRAELARFFKSVVANLDPIELKNRLDIIADCLRHGYSYPGLDFKTPVIALNNQSKMRVYDAQFGGQTPLRVIPQDVGDNVMFFPTPTGGVEIYIRDVQDPERHAKLMTPQWQALIRDF